MEYLLKYGIIGISLIMSIFILLIDILFIKKKTKVLGIVFSSIIVSINIFYIFMYERFILPNETFSLIFIISICSFLLYYIVRLLGLILVDKKKNRNKKDVLDSLGELNYNFYLYLNRKGTIKEASEEVCSLLDIDRKEIIGKNIVKLCDKKIRITKYNDNEITNKDFFEAYTTKKYRTSKNVLEIKNKDGLDKVLSFLEKYIIENGILLGIVIVGRLSNNKEYLSEQKTMDMMANDIESLQYKMSSLIEISEEGIFFNDLNSNSIWGNDVWKNNVNLGQNEISITSFKTLMHEDDVLYYIEKIKSLTPKSPVYEIRYRVSINGNYQYIYEKGRRLFEDSNQNVIVGYTKKINSNFFEYTGIPVIDQIKTTDDLNILLERLYNKNYFFQLVCVDLHNLPEINKIYGRNVGNIIMSEYLKRLKDNFLSESGGIYRYTGKTFYFVMTDGRKMEMFKRGLTSNMNSMNFTMQVGAHRVELCVKLGIAEASDDGANKEELIENCNKAISFAIAPNCNTTFIYYKDIKNVGI